MFNTATISNVATSLVGVAFCSVAALALTVPSAHAAAPVGFQTSVETSIAQTMRFPGAVKSDQSGIATLAVSVAADGSVSNVDIVKSSGERSFDREAIRTARAVSYPASGKAQTIAMTLGFNRAPDSATARQGRVLVDAYRNDHRQLLATETTAQPNG